MDSAHLHDAVSALGSELRRALFPLGIDGAAEAGAIRDELVGQIEDYLLPRLLQIDAPLLAVAGGSTGAGKSTLVNSLVGRVVSAAGVLRPTTTTPVLVAHPDDISWFEGERILPGLPRATGVPAAGSRSLHLVADADVPRGIALLDAPDVDSVVQANRELATQLLAAADLWMFVTTAARYADAVPWDFLRRARARSTALALVLNRVPVEALEEVPNHLREMLRREGLEDAPVLTVPEAPLEGELIPGAQLEPVVTWLQDLASDANARAEVVRRTLAGALSSLPARVEVVVVQLEAQSDAADALASEASRAYDVALEEVEHALSGGALLRSEVLARWHEFVGTGDVMRSLQSGIGRFRDRLNELILGQPPVEKEVRTEVQRSIETVVVAAADKAVEHTLSAWRATPPARSLVQDPDVPRRSSAQLAGAIESEVRAWQGRVLELVKAQGAGKRAAGRAVSFGVNAVGAALMIAVFAQTGGLTGGEVAIAGGTAALSQRLLEALFGDEAVRMLTNEARSDLLSRLRHLLEAEAVRFEAAARRDAPAPEQVAALRTSLAAVEEARLS
ncbi:MAG: GTPase domain-containing protein [Actinomycetota bacterium]|nr:GTPase domain-containing protein [Actinomycetota bacterium]